MSRSLASSEGVVATTYAGGTVEASVAPHTIELSAATPISDTSAMASSCGRLENISPSLSRNTLSASTPKTRHSGNRSEHKVFMSLSLAGAVDGCRSGATFAVVQHLVLLR